MLLFYAHTNAQLLNMANVKANLFPDEEADLVVHSSPVISKKIIKEIIKTGTFRQVRQFQKLEIDSKQLPMKNIPGLRTLVYYKTVRRYLDNFFESFAPEEGYKRIFVSYFFEGGYQLYISAWCKKKNKNLKISFVEEGTGSYYLKDKDIFRVRLFKKGLKGMFHWRLLDGRHIEEMTKRVDQTYLYRPELYRYNPQLERVQIPMVTEENPTWPIWESLSRSIDSVHSMRLERSKLIYFSTYFLGETAEAANKRSDEIVEMILSCTRPSTDIIKVHTNSSAHAQKFAEQFEDQVYVDREVYHFESQCTQMDMSKKIFISNVSTAMMYPKFIFDQEPILIFTYKLYPFYIMFGSERDDLYVQDMVDTYSDPSRVYIPNSMGEFSQMLEEAYRRVMAEEKYL